MTHGGGGRALWRDSRCGILTVQEAVVLEAAATEERVEAVHQLGAALGPSALAVDVRRAVRRRLLSAA